MTERPTNPEMIEGYLDGLNLNNPEPSENRSASYRHGFANGRADKTGEFRGLSFKSLTALADRAMDEDDRKRLQ